MGVIVFYFLNQVEWVTTKLYLNTIQLGNKWMV